MSQVRKIFKIKRSQTTLEGAGVKLNRVFGEDHPKLDPFLLLDDFSSDNPEDYKAGFPYHPHRGIETITYILKGKVAHEDSLNNKGVIKPGGVQWMTAGSGIIHQEMPESKEGLVGFQLWANLPKKNKMMNPRYRSITKDDIPEIKYKGSTIKIICGEINGVQGPITDVVADPEYLDITIPPKNKFTYSVDSEKNVFAYIFEGEAFFDENEDYLVSKHHLVIFDKGETIQITTQKSSVRFLLISGKPLKEPVAWRGPIVMNTSDELRTAFAEYRNGEFVKYKIQMD